MTQHVKCLLASTACQLMCPDMPSLPNKQECQGEYVRERHESTENTVEQTNVNAESDIPCFSGEIDKKGGILSSGTITLIVPPFAVSKPTQFSCRMISERSVFPALMMPGGHYVMSPTVSLAPHGENFQQKVAFQFPFAAVPEGWLIRLIYCPLNGDRWEALLDVIIPQGRPSSSVMIASYTGTWFDFATNSIFAGHLCKKRWTAVPLSHGSKIKICATLFGRQLNPTTGTWEIIVRFCYPISEEYDRLAKYMHGYRAQPLIEAPETLEIGEAGVVRIVFESDQSQWRLKDGPEVFETEAKSTFWLEKDSLDPFRGYRRSFIVSPVKEVDYLRVFVSVSYIDNNKKHLISKQLVGTASLSSCPEINNFHLKIKNCHDFAIGRNNQITNQILMPMPLLQYLDKYVADTARRLQVSECGQEASICLFSFPRGGDYAPLQCTIYYMSRRDVSKEMKSQGARTTEDPYLVQTEKPSWPHPDTAVVLIRDEKGCAVAFCHMSFGESQLPVTNTVLVEPLFPFDKQEDKPNYEMPIPSRVNSAQQAKPAEKESAPASGTIYAIFVLKSITSICLQFCSLIHFQSNALLLNWMTSKKRINFSKVTMNE
jgi:hypothetical protein